MRKKEKILLLGVMLLYATPTASFAAAVTETVVVAPLAEPMLLEISADVIVITNEGSTAEYDQVDGTLLITRSNGSASLMEPDALGRPLVVTRWRPNGEQSESVFIYDNESDRLERVDFDNGMTAVVQYGTALDQNQVVLILHDADGGVIGEPYEVPTLSPEPIPLDDDGQGSQTALLSPSTCFVLAQACLGSCNDQQSSCESDCVAHYPGVLEGGNLSDCLDDCDLYWDTLCPAGCYAGGALCATGVILP